MSTRVIADAATTAFRGRCLISSPCSALFISGVPASSLKRGFFGIIRFPKSRHAGEFGNRVNAAATTLGHRTYTGIVSLHPRRDQPAVCPCSFPTGKSALADVDIAACSPPLFQRCASFAVFFSSRSFSIADLYLRVTDLDTESTRCRDRKCPRCRHFCYTTTTTFTAR